VVVEVVVGLCQGRFSPSFGLLLAMCGRLSHHLLRIYVWCQNRWGSPVATSTDILIVVTFVQETVTLDHPPFPFIPIPIPGVFLWAQASESETCLSEFTLLGHGLMLLLPW